MTTSNHSALKGFLNRLLKRSVLSTGEQEAILGLASRAVHAPPHRAIVRQGDTVDHACLVVDGLVGRYDQMREGHRQFTALHIPGDMCDLHSVVAPTAAWGIEALSAATVLQVPHEELLTIATRHPAIAIAFWRDTTADAAVMAKWISNVGRKDARSRLAHLFCEMGIRMDEAGLADRTQYPLPMTQEQLSDAVGLTPVHTNRMLQWLRAEGGVTFIGRVVEISDWDRLAEIAEFQPDFLLLRSCAKPPSR